MYYAKGAAATTGHVVTSFSRDQNLLNALNVFEYFCIVFSFLERSPENRFFEKYLQMFFFYFSATP
jgi:hypothetical protein